MLIRARLVAQGSSEAKAFAELVSSQLGDAGWLTGSSKPTRKRPTRARARGRTQVGAVCSGAHGCPDSLEGPLQSATQRFWESAASTVITVSDATNASRAARATPSGASLSGLNGKGKRDRPASSALASIKPVPPHLRLHHNKRWEEWRPTRSDNEWGNPLRQPVVDNAPATVGSHSPDRRVHTVFSAGPRRAKLRREEAAARAREAERKAAWEAAERERIRLANLKPPPPEKVRWNWKHETTYVKDQVWKRRHGRDGT